jgi:hypothetical protein
VASEINVATIDAGLMTGLDLSDPSSEEHVLRGKGYTGRRLSTRL